MESQTALSIAECYVFGSVDVMSTAPESMTLAKALAVFTRAARGMMTQPEFGKLTGLPQSTISAIETGSRDVRVTHVDAILAATKMDVPRLLRELGKIARGEQPAKDGYVEEGKGIALSEEIANRAPAKRATAVPAAGGRRKKRR
jgi:transcriptional regulator with XRE-family HTH domain